MQIILPPPEIPTFSQKELDYQEARKLGLMEPLEPILYLFVIVFAGISTGLAFWDRPNGNLYGLLSWAIVILFTRLMYNRWRKRMDYALYIGPAILLLFHGYGLLLLTLDVAHFHR